jgi:hypothetical protein
VSEQGQPRSLSRLDAGVLIVLVAMAVAAVGGVIAVLTADSSAGGLGIGLGIAILVFAVGGTVACAVACLARSRLELAALGAIVASGLAVDLAVFAIWLEIDSSSYAKLLGLAVVWSLFALPALGLALVVPRPERLSLACSAAAYAATATCGVIASILVLRAGDDRVTVATAPVPAPVGDDALLQVLGAMLVLLAATWFGALAASRLPDHTLKRTLTTSPSSTM